MTSIRIATRGSELARWQADHVASAIRAAHPGTDVELVVVSTEGDRRQDVPLSEIGGKGVFVKEIQRAVLDGRADLAVHSAKDLPAVGPAELSIVAVPERADPRDALVGVALVALPQGGRVATGSRRRAAQLRALRPDLEIRGLRGNIATRLAKADEHHAVVVAVAALQRLGLDDRIADVLSVDEMCPQVGQGTLAVEGLPGSAAAALVSVMDHAPSRRCLEAERAFLGELGGDCDLPAGAYAEVDDDQIVLRAVLDSGAGVRRLVLEGVDGVALGVEAARRLRAEAG